MSLTRLVAITVLILLIGSPVSVSSAQTREEAVLWTSIQNSDNPEDYRAYLDAYPNGTFAPLAKRRIANMEAAKSAADARRERGESEIRKLVGSWTSGPSLSEPSSPDSSPWEMTAELIVALNSTGGATGQLSTRGDLMDRKRRFKYEDAWCLWNAELEFMPAEDGTLSWKVVSARVRCHNDRDWFKYENPGGKHFELSDGNLHLHILLDRTLSPSDSPNWLLPPLVLNRK
jgi:hypothetical protein